MCRVKNKLGTKFIALFLSVMLIVATLPLNNIVVSAAGAGTDTFTVTVTDSTTSNPVNGAAVTVTNAANASDTETKTTDSSGKAIFNTLTDGGNYNYTVTSNEYVTKNGTFSSIPNNGTSTVTITQKSNQTGFKFATTNPAAQTYSSTFSFSNAASGGQSTGIIAYAITGGTGSATINAATGTITNVTAAGTITVQATKAGDAAYKDVTDTYTLTINKADQTAFVFTTPSPTDKTYSPTFHFSNAASGGQSAGTITYTITGGSGSASIDSTAGTITNVTNTGTIIVTATKSGDSVYNDISATYTVTIKKADQTGFAFLTSNPAEEAYSPTFSFSNTASGGQSAGTIAYAISGGTGSASINPSTGAITNVTAAGTIIVQATKASDAVYNNATDTYTLTIKKADQTGFVFATPSPTDQTYSLIFSFSNTASGGQSTGTITYAITGGTGSASINSSTGTITNVTAPGTIIVTATKSGNSVYNNTTATYTVTINKADQTGFKFAATNPAAKTYSPTFSFSNAASGGQSAGTITYAITGGTGSATIDTAVGTITDVTAAGTITVQATKAGDSVYNNATDTYTLTINKADQTGFSFATLSPTNISYGQTFQNIASGGQSNTPIIYTVTQRGDYASVDSNGTISCSLNPSAADAGAVTISVQAKRTGDSVYNDSTASYNLTFDRSYVNSDRDFTVNSAKIKASSDLTDRNNWYNAADVSSYGNQITIAPINGYSQISANGTTWSNSLVFPSEAKINANFYLKKADGSISNISRRTINFDKSAPEQVTLKIGSFNAWSDFWNTITFGLFSKDNQQIQIAASDSLSGVKSIEYHEDNSGRDLTFQEASGLAYKPYDNNNKPLVSLSGLESKNVVVYAKVTDFASNITYYRSNGIVFDNINPTGSTTITNSPVVQIALSNSATEGLYNKDVPFRVQINDPQTNGLAAGLASVTTTISAPGKTSKVITATAKSANYNCNDATFDSSSIDTSSFSNTGTYVVDKSFDSDHITITVVTIDKAGNRFTKSVNLGVDVTNPAIKVTYDNNTFSNNTYLGIGLGRKATIDINELNFDNSKVVIDVKRNGIRLNITPTFTAISGAVNRNGDQTGWRMQIDYSQFGDGDYTFDVSCSDKAGNTNAKVDYANSINPQVFTIDNTKPIIAVAYDNNSSKDANYFKTDRTATIKVIEHNWRASNFVLNLLSENNETGAYRQFTSPSLSQWTDNGDVHTATIHYYADGRYTFSASYTDLAGNKAADVPQQIFMVDKTVPTISKTLTAIGVGQVNGAKSTVAPHITISDNDFDPNNVKISLVGSKNGIVNPTGSWSKNADGRGGVYTFQNFADDRATDDVYTMNVTATDKAGNQSTSGPITFSVNRYGSTFDMTKMKGLKNAYVKSISDIAFAEINPSTVSADSYMLSLSQNGNIEQLSEGSDYTRICSAKYATWSEYTYTIKANNFKNDGLYVINLKDKDTANNQNSSDNVSQNGYALSFTLDNTKPTAAISGVASNQTYSMNNQNAVIAISDNTKLKSYTVKLNGNNITKECRGVPDKLGNIKLNLSIPANFNRQNLVINCTDEAGNQNPITISNFLVNSNVFVQYYQNKPLFYGSVGGITLIAILVTAFFIYKRKKSA